MSRRSYDSATHERRMSKHRVTDDELFNHVLRVAVLSYLMQPKAQSPVVSQEAREKDYSSRISGALSRSMALFDVGDLIKDMRDGHKNVKFPEKLVKVLEAKLQGIAMGKDPSYSDQLTRRTMAVFYGQLTQDSFRRQIKDNRKIEELILMFATHSTTVLKKEPTLAGDGWKLELNNQIAFFVRLLQECLRGLHHVPSELTTRLDNYAAKLAPAQQAAQQAFSDSGYDSSSTTGNRDSVYSAPAPQSTSASIAEMPLVQIVANLFKIPQHVMQQEVDQLRKYCTERAALMDLKTCLKNINAGSPFPGRREDFMDDEAWNYWRTLETSHLSQLMVVMVKLSPDLAKSMPSSDAYNPPSPSLGGRPTSVYSQRSGRDPRGSVSNRKSLFGGNINMESIGEDIDGDDEIPVGHHFTFIPPNPKKYYKRLLEYCLSADLEAMLSDEVNDDDEVSLGILSPPHIELINECALRWRISQSYRATCFLDLVKQFFERNDVPLECIPEALQTCQRVMSELELDKWAIADTDYLANVYASLFTLFISSLYHAMEGIPNLKPSEIAPYTSILEHVRESGLLERFDVDVIARLADVQERAREAAADNVDKKYRELCGQAGANVALPLLLLSDEIEKHAKLLDKRFPSPILGELDITSLVVEIEVPFFMSNIQGNQKALWESSMNGPQPQVPIQDVFALYRRTKTMLDMHKAFCPNETINFNIGDFFEPYVRQWLVNTDNKTTQWVQAAIAADKFEAEDASGHSSSIVDLFDSLRSPISFLEDLEWSDGYQNARFFTSLAKTISKAVEQYCRNIEDLFMTEMFPRPTDFLQPQKSSAWLEKAKQLANGEKKVEVFNFKPESCVKMNNVEAARRLLDSMYNQMDAEKLSRVIEEHGPPVPDKHERQRFLFTVKISIAEDLVALDGSPSSKLDTFVTLSDEGGNRLAKTRTIYENMSPRWDETFDISVEKPLWLMVSIRDRALVGKHDTVGRAYICLDPKRFGDFLTHDLWLDLDTTGRILLRVSMEGEKDDVLFYFGRAFRSLKRSEGDMARIFIDKMLPLIQQTLSPVVLKTLVNTGKSLDYTKAIGGITTLYKSALGSTSNEVQIPLHQSEKPRFKPDDLTDVQIEAALAPLFDYLDANLPTLNTYLSDTAKELIMSKIWKEILHVIESLLIPPLSDKPSDLKPLSDKEVDIVFKWMKFLRDYFYIGGEGPMSIEELQNQKFREIMSIRLYYDWHTDALMEECVRMMQQQLRAAPSIKKRAKSVYQQRNLGTIKDRKKEKKEEKEVSSGEVIMRILRMRPGTQDFIAQQLQIVTQMQAEQEKRAQQRAQRGSRRLGQNRERDSNAIPPVPTIPE